MLSTSLFKNRPQPRNWKLIIGIPVITLLVIGFLFLTHSFTPDPNASGRLTGFTSYNTTLSSILSAVSTGIPSGTEVASVLNPAKPIELGQNPESSHLDSVADTTTSPDSHSSSTPVSPNAAVSSSHVAPANLRTHAFLHFSGPSAFWAFEGLCVTLFGIAIWVLRRKDDQYLRHLQRRVNTGSSQRRSLSGSTSITNDI